jgi:creatinine amidohydrolase
MSKETVSWGRYEELRPDQIEAIKNKRSVAYIPWGAIEYHGIHNPIGLDGIKAYGLCLELAQVAGGCVLPTVYHATSTIKTIKDLAHRQHSIEHSEDLLKLLAEELFLQLADEGFRVVVLLTGHAGQPHMDILKEAAIECEKKCPNSRFWAIAEFDIVEDSVLVANHSARGETALQLHYRPDLVALDRLDEGDAPTLERDAVWGEDPRLATEKEGAEIAGAFVEAAKKRIDVLLDESI